ncbi:hypothetical protein HLB23_03580 [Nocardia uniformis]|uniref:Uncharacterized protein n=1 Tax=Nocardia uniformis TaxID=53432 RepID=A0A849BQI6_9NOCA|nr:DUF6412 domain-containing protein [Nocardia uniformis]NNH68962.1 hypothetical protein [Nocardia uniformis]
MFYGWRNAWEIVSALLLAWAAATVGSAFAQPEAISLVLIGFAVACAVAAHLLACETQGLVSGQGRAIRGPTTDEQRLRGSFRRHSHPDAPGRSRPRAPGARAGAELPVG